MIGLICLMMIYSYADRFAGGGAGWQKLGKDHGGPLGSRPLYWAALISGAIVWMSFGWPAALIGTLTLLIWRGPGWKVFGRGGLAPQSVSDGAMLALRHALAGVGGLAAVWVGLDPYRALTGSLAFIVTATLIGAAYGASVRRGHDVGAWTEIIRGAGFGAMMWWMIG